MARKRKSDSEELSDSANLTDDEEKQQPVHPVDDVEDLVSELDEGVIIDEPDEELLAQATQGLGDVTEDETL
jgi:hypothetical protein